MSNCIPEEDEEEGEDDEDDNLQLDINIFKTKDDRNVRNTSDECFSLVSMRQGPVDDDLEGVFPLNLEDITFYHDHHINTR